MRTGFVHEATVALEPDADRRAPGAAITRALCGSWKHEGRCPLAAHRTDLRDGNVHIVFACEPADEGEVRRRIREALQAGSEVRPEGGVARWRLVSDAVGVLGADDVALARRLAAG